MLYCTIFVFYTFEQAFDPLVLVRILSVSAFLAIVNTFFWMRQPCIGEFNWTRLISDRIDLIFADLNLAMKKTGEIRCESENQNYMELGRSNKSSSQYREHPSTITLDSSPTELKPLTVGDVCVRMNEILFVKDTQVLNPKFAHKFIEKELLGTYVMIRGYKDPKYWTSE